MTREADDVTRGVVCTQRLSPMRDREQSSRDGAGDQQQDDDGERESCDAVQLVGAGARESGHGAGQGGRLPEIDRLRDTCRAERQHDLPAQSSDAYAAYSTSCTTRPVSPSEIGVSLPRTQRAKCRISWGKP